MALATLHQLSANQYSLFKQNLNTLIEFDSRVSLPEWSIQKIVFHHLDPVFTRKPGTTPQNLRLRQAKDACAVLLSVLVYSGKQQGINNNDVFDDAIEQLGIANISLLAKSEISLDSLDSSLDRLTKLKPLEKPLLLKACARCITADQKITSYEVEVYRAIAAILDCPMPPLVL
jgi:hypothetical protein